jgi:hypothetical protein
MIDLSPQPHEDSATTAELRPAARQSPTRDLGPAGEQGSGRWWLAHDRAEAGVQLLSRWAGPFIFIAAIGALAWFLLR